MGSARLLPQTIGAEIKPFARGQMVADEGDRPFWDLWLRSLPLIMRAIARFRVPAGSDEADFRQAVLERVERKCRRAFGAFEGRCSLASYVRRIVGSAAIEELRARRRVSARRCPLSGHSFALSDFEKATNEPEDDAQGPASQLECSDRTEMLVQALQALASESEDSLRIAKVVVWRCVDRRPRQDIAQDLGVSVRQVNRYVLAGLSRLRRTLGQTYGVLSEDDL